MAQYIDKDALIAEIEKRIDMKIDDILIDKFTDKLAEKIANRIMKDGTFPLYPADVPNVVMMYACPPTDFKPMPYTTMSNATNKED